MLNLLNLKLFFIAVGVIQRNVGETPYRIKNYNDNIRDKDEKIEYLFDIKTLAGR